MQANAKSKQATVKRPATAPTDVGKLVVSTETAAAMFGYTAERLRQLEKAGRIKKAGRNQFRLKDLAKGIVGHFEDLLQKTRDESGQRFRDARAREIELRIARDEKLLIDVEDVDALVSEIVSGFRSDLSGVPAACTRDLQLRRLIETQIESAIDRCRQRFEEAQKASWQPDDQE